MAAIFLVSQIPPDRPNAGCKIDAAPWRKISANSALVVSRSPVAIGVVTARATLAISAKLSGGIGSSNHSGLNGSNALPRRMAPAVENCPCVPNKRSAL